jgi:PPM family protein phosphatase
MKFSIFQDSAVGGRQNNQDRMGYCFTREAVLMVVADGLGGHFGGEIAAEITVRAIAAQFEANAKPSLGDPALFLTQAIGSAHREILAQTIEHQYPDTPRTTVAVCVIQGGKAWWAHAGDSRCYLYRGGRLANRTRDHSKLETMISLGLLDQSESNSHPDRNKVLNCLGIEIEPLVEVSRPINLQPSDLFFLCTDGVWSAGSDDGYGKRLLDMPLAASLPNLIQWSVKTNGKFADNATGLALQWEPNDALATPTEISSDWLPDGAVTTTVLAEIDRNSVPVSLTDEEIEDTIGEIRKAIAGLKDKKR